MLEQMQSLPPIFVSGEKTEHLIATKLTVSVTTKRSTNSWLASGNIGQRMKLNHAERLLILSLLGCELLRLASRIEDIDERVWKENNDDPGCRIARENRDAQRLTTKKARTQANQKPER
jgi:hypothetical protein